MAKKKEFAVIGLGIFGRTIAKGLIKRGNSVLGIDRNLMVIESNAMEFTDLVKADTTQIETLKELGIADFDIVIVGIGDIERSILTAQLLKEIGVKFIIARAQNETHEHILYKIGVDKVIIPEKDMGDRIAMMLSGSVFLDIVDLAEDFSIAGIKVGNKYSGMDLEKIEFRKTFGVTAIMVHRNGVSYPLNSPKDKLFKGDIVFVSGRYEELEKIKEI